VRVVVSRLARARLSVGDATVTTTSLAAAAGAVLLLAAGVIILITVALALSVDVTLPRLAPRCWPVTDVTARPASAAAGV